MIPLTPLRRLCGHPARLYDRSHAPRRLYTTSHRRQRLVPPQRLRAAAQFKSGRHMRWHIKVLRGCNVCANSFIALRAPRRAPRFLPREILTFPRRLSASLPHHGPPPATPRPMTYHPRDNATAHGPRDNVPPPATMPRDNVLPPATQHPRRTQPRQRCRGARAKLTAPPYASAVTRAHSDASPDEATNAAQRRHTRPTQQPPHEAPPQRHPQRRSTTRRHTGARAKHQGATQLPHDTPVQRHGARSKAPSRPKHNRSAWLHHDTTDEQHDTPKPDQSVTKRHGGAYRHYPLSTDAP